MPYVHVQKIQKNVFVKMPGQASFNFGTSLVWLDHLALLQAFMATYELSKKMGYNFLA